MKFEDKLSAIQFIRPKAIFNLRGDEIEWLDETQIEPTDAEIKSGLTAFLAAQKAEVNAKAAAKTAAQAKLAALGLTVEDLTALGL
jgi:hypothetical protein